MFERIFTRDHVCRIYGRAFGTCRVLNTPHKVTSTSHRSAYDDTVSNLFINSETRVIFQGFTGRQATANAAESLAWGTKIVGGVKPKFEGEHLGLPVYPSVRKAAEALKPHATGIYVAAAQAAEAIEEAIEAEIPLIVAVAEHIPLHEILKIHYILATQSKCRLVGANSPGIVSAIGRCRIGFQPLPAFSPGHVGIVSKSGTLSYETVASLTRAGVGQSLCIGIGGDVVAGTSFVDALRVFERDDDTHAIIIVGELGGSAEEEAAEWMIEYKRRCADPKPIAALVAGLSPIPGRVMGHAGAWCTPGDASAQEKWTALEKAGAMMVDHPAKFGLVMKSLLQCGGSRSFKMKKSQFASGRAFTMLTRPCLRNETIRRGKGVQRLHLSVEQAAQLIKPLQISEPRNHSPGSLIAGISIARTARKPCILLSSLIEDMRWVVQVPFDYRTGPQQVHVSEAVTRVGFTSLTKNAELEFRELIFQLWKLFLSHEAVLLTVQINPTNTGLQTCNPDFTFDDAAFKVAKRQSSLHTQRDLSRFDPIELAGEPHGIVYLPLSGSTRSIGTLVNGAGLAMNTIDALSARGLQATNFLDTGGKATAETVKMSFELILADPRVRVVFVNIFGGLTLCDMIARGVLLAFEQVQVNVPVVVRLRGTNEELGQKIISESGLSLWVFDGFEDAVEKLKELS